MKRSGAEAGAEGAADSAPRAGASRAKRGTKRAGASGAAEDGPGPAEEEAAPGPADAGQQASAPVLGAGTSAVDVSMLRGNWSTVISHLRGQGKAVLPSFLEIATPAAFDGTTLELVFPPDRKFGVSKVEERAEELRQALLELFGVAPAVRCVVREPAAGPSDPVEEEPPLSEEAALARLTAELGATPAGEDS